MEDRIVLMISRLVLPFIQMYGIYVILHGHLSPGGGFSGGAVFGAGLVLLSLAFNLTTGFRKISHRTASFLESSGVLGFILVGLTGLVLGGGFLANKLAGFPVGVPGRLFSSGAILLITVFIGIKVASTVLTLFCSLVEEEEKNDDPGELNP